MIKYLKNKQGFTLLELILVVAVLVVIVAVSRDFFGSFIDGNTLLNENTVIAFNLRSARDKAMNGQNDMNWGVHFVNDSQDYYEIFSSPTDYSNASTTVVTKIYLGNNIAFSNPTEGSALDIIFLKITGMATSSNVELVHKGNKSTISVSSQGFIRDGDLDIAQGATANLTNLILSGSPTGYSFNGATYTYNGVTVLNAVSSITVTPSGAGVITVDGVQVTSGQASATIDLVAEVEKSISVVVTETGMSAKTYTLKVTRAAQGATANLTNLILSGSPTGYSFNGATYTYNGVTVLNAVSSITVTPSGAGVITVDGVQVTSGQASATIDLVAEVEKSISVVVTETGMSAKTYNIYVTREAPVPFNCGQVFVDTRDTNSYPTVQIGTQCWMTKNLAYLPSVSPSGTGDAINPYYYVYDYQGTSVSVAKSSGNYTSYGALYNHISALTACPTGWHLPSEAEGTTLINFVKWFPGCDQWSGCGPGTVLKAAPADPLPWDGTNNHNLSIIHGGQRHNSWGFTAINAGAYIWSAAINGSNTIFWKFYDGDNRADPVTSARDFGNSVRCLKD